MKLKLRWMYGIFERIEEVKIKRETVLIVTEVENQEYFA